MSANATWQKSGRVGEGEKSVCSVNVHVPARGTPTGREVREYIHTYKCLTKG